MRRQIYQYSEPVTNTPFRETATKIAESKGYVAMQAECGGTPSHTWWKRLVEGGAWKDRGWGRVSPPPPNKLGGIANLFGTTVEQVAAMIAADWYGVHPKTEVSARVLRMSPVLDKLTETDSEMVEALARRLARD
jgi:hypothetical protein